MAVQGIAPILVQGTVLSLVTGTLNVQGIVPDVITQNNVYPMPDTGSLSLVGVAPEVVGGEVITPTGTALLIGSAPSVAVSGFCSYTKCRRCDTSRYSTISTYR